MKSEDIEKIVHNSYLFGDVFWFIYRLRQRAFLVRITCIAIGTICIVLITFLTRGQKYRILFNKEMYSLYGELKKLVDDVDKSVKNRRLISLIEQTIKLNETLLNAKCEFPTIKKYYEYKNIIVLIDELLIQSKNI